MKRIYKYCVLTAVVGAASFTWSCSDFLNTPPTGKLTEQQVYAGDQTSLSVVTGLYDNYRNIIKDRQGMVPWWGTDEVQMGNFQLNSERDQRGMDEYNASLHPSNARVGSDIWDRRWPTVVGAARAIYNLGRVEDTASVEQVLAEARFIRGIVMFELAMWFGEIPIYDMVDDGTGTGVLVSKHGTGRMPLTQVWQFIIDDFAAGATALPDNWSEPYRATKGAALTMLAKAYMSAPESTGLRDFSKASAALAQIIGMGKYSLHGSYNGLWDNSNPPYNPPNTSETIFLLNFNNGGQRNMWEFSIGSRMIDAWFGQGCYFDGYDAMVPTPFMYRMIDEPVETEASQYLAGAAQKGIWEEGDLRREAAIRYDFSYYTDRVKQDGSSGTPGVYAWITPDLSKTTWTQTTDEADPHIKKHEDYRTDTGSGLGYNNMWESGKVFPALRYADVLLMQAECLNELNKTAEGVALVQQVRQRAWGAAVPAAWNPTSQQDFRDMIMDERLRELCFEGHRRTDLIRTGKFVELVKARNRWANLAGTINANSVRYPIPLSELQTNPDMTEADQNPGYVN